LGFACGHYYSHNWILLGKIQLPPKTTFRVVHYFTRNLLSSAASFFGTMFFFDNYIRHFGSSPRWEKKCCCVWFNLKPEEGHFAQLECWEPQWTPHLAGCMRLHRKAVGWTPLMKLLPIHIHVSCHPHQNQKV
jgi:hypothetical protein